MVCAMVVMYMCSVCDNEYILKHCPMKVPLWTAWGMADVAWGYLFSCMLNEPKSVALSYMHHAIFPFDGSVVIFTSQKVISCGDSFSIFSSR